MHAICGRSAESIQANCLNGEMNVNWKLTAALACSAAFLVGACSGNNNSAAGAASGSENGGTDGNGNGGTDGNANGDSIR